MSARPTFARALPAPAQGTPPEPAELLARWRWHRWQSPGLPLETVAAKLAVRPVVLVASACDVEATRLRPEWCRLLTWVRRLGAVTAETGNRHAALLSRGGYEHVSVDGQRCLAIGDGVALRFRPGDWTAGFFHACGDVSTGPSLCFFDAHGHLVHQLRVAGTRCGQGCWQLRALFGHPNQQRHEPVKPAPPPSACLPDRAVFVPGLRAAWRSLASLEEFDRMLRAFRTRPPQALRLVGRDLAWPMTAEELSSFFQRLRRYGIPATVVVASMAAEQVCTGPPTAVTRRDHSLRVTARRFELRLDDQAAAAMWLVRRFTRQESFLSLEAYDDDGRRLVSVEAPRCLDRPAVDAWARTLETVLSNATSPSL